jgi:hypothetical protein
MIKMSHVLTALLLTTSISVAHAETANQPVAQGAASVEKNLGKQPENKGLQNASERLKENEGKTEEKRADADKRHDHHEMHEKHEKHEKHDRMEKHEHEKMEHPAKPDRPVR